jgi:hypothetical protein
MLTALKICLPLLAIWIALCLVCALRVTRRRRTGASQVAGDPFLFPFGEMPWFTADELRRIAPMPHTKDPLRRSFETTRSCRVLMTSSYPPRVGDHSISRRMFPISLSAGLALRPDAGGDGSSFHPDPAAVRFSLLRRMRRG